MEELLSGFSLEEEEEEEVDLISKRGGFGSLMEEQFSFYKQIKNTLSIFHTMSESNINKISKRF